MTAPTLDDLRDIHLPPEPGMWPPAPVWWVVAAVVVAGIAAGIAVLARRHARRRPLRAALREAVEIGAKWRHDGDSVQLAAALSRLLRRYAAWRFPGHPVAGLVGPAWLDFLDVHGGNGEFQRGVGALLDSLPYRPPAGAASGALADEQPRAADCEALLALVHRWLQANAP